MAVSPVNRVQAGQGGTPDPAGNGPQVQPAPVQDAERSRRGQPTDQVVFSQEARNQAAQTRPQQEGSFERLGQAARVEFDRRQEEAQAVAGQATRAEARRNEATADRPRTGLDVNA